MPKYVKENSLLGLESTVRALPYYSKYTVQQGNREKFQQVNWKEEKNRKQRQEEWFADASKRKKLDKTQRF